MDEILRRRRQIARDYDQKLKALKIPWIKLLEVPDRVHSSYYKYIVYLEPPLEREKLKQILKQDYGVSLPGELYNRDCHRQPVFARYPEAVVPQRNGSFPETEYVVSHHCCLPLYPSLEDEQVEYVVASLDRAVRCF
jgi:dTDP-4-amino-4,6-dideoxygalactose transaminase